MSPQSVKLTEYSHGAGCGCKIAPNVLDVILQSALPSQTDGRLIVGNQSRDDAAVYDIGNGMGIVSTTDFFMPIVDDAFDFGRIAATNAISDVYAMGGTPLMAIAILGWPVNVLPATVAQQVVEGGRQACADAGIPLAGGHSIDAPEPIFGLAVTGSVPLAQLKRNDTARAGDRLYLSKPLGIGVLSTAQKKKILRAEHTHLARDWMCRLNRFGTRAATLAGVTAMTDITGFGLVGHLSEMCEGAGVAATIAFHRVPIIPAALDYLREGAIPGGTGRNWESYRNKVRGIASDEQQHILCDPQTSGGLLIAVKPDTEAELLALARADATELHYIGELHAGGDALITVTA